MPIILRDLDAWFLVFAFTMSYTMAAPWAALMPSTLSKLHVPPVIIFVIKYLFYFSGTYLIYTYYVFIIKIYLFYLKEISAKCGLFMIIHTFFLSLTISTFADRAPGCSKELALFSRFISLIFIFWLMLIMNFHAKMTASKCITMIVTLVDLYKYID